MLVFFFPFRLLCKTGWVLVLCFFVFVFFPAAGTWRTHVPPPNPRQEGVTRPAALAGTPASPPRPRARRDPGHSPAGGTGGPRPSSYGTRRGAGKRRAPPPHSPCAPPSCCTASAAPGGTAASFGLPFPV